MKKQTFNIFEILSKDDKELSHSSMVKFLFEESSFFTEKLINVNNEGLDIRLEYKLDKRLRLDIIIFVDNKVIAIENKFKCLPQIRQLESYSKKLKEKFQDRVIKYLLYFEKGKDFNLPSDWIKITYEDLQRLTDEYLERKGIDKDIEVLIRHYSKSLSNYIQKYKELKNPNSNLLREIFVNPQNGNNRFWLRLIFHELGLLFDEEKFKTWIGSGSTYKPLINIHNPKWDFKSEKGFEFVIQLNGKNLKYYSHLSGLENKQEILLNEKERLTERGFVKSKSGKFKEKIKERSNTSYIYQEDIIEVIESKGKKVTLDNIKISIEELIEKIENCG